MSEQSRLSSIVTVGVANGAVFLFGIGIQVAIAALFGAGRDLDAFLIASTVPAWLYQIVKSSFSTAFIPAFLERKTSRGEKDAWRAFSPVLNGLLFFTATLALLGCLNARIIVSIIAPGLDTQTSALAAQLSRWLFPMMIGAVLVTVFTGIYQAYNRFFIPACAPFLQKLAKLVIFYSGATLAGIWSLAIAETVSWLLVAAIMLLGLVPLRGFYRLRTIWQEGDWRLFIAMGGFIFAALLVRSYTLVDRYVASSLPEGSISYLYYAQMIVLLIRSILAESAMTVFFPSMVVLLANQEIDKLKATVVKGIRLTGYFMAPAIVGLLAFREPLVQLLLERGNFAGSDTQAVAQVLVAYTGILFASTFGSVLVRVIFAAQAVRFVVVNNALLFVVYASSCLLLSHRIGVIGIALSYSLVLNINWILMFVYLHKRLGGFSYRELVGSIGLSMGCAAVMGVFVRVAYSTAIGKLNGLGAWGLVGAVLVATITGALVYITESLLLKREEVLYVVKHIRGFAVRSRGALKEA